MTKELYVEISPKVREYSVPFKAFFISRAGLFLLIYLTLVFFPVQSGHKYWHAFPGNRFLDGWARFDSGWYARIARFGYKNIPTRNGQDTNFFPMDPLLIRRLTKVVGNVFLSGIIISNTCFLLALMGLFRLVRERNGYDLARRAVYLLAFNPFSFFFSAVYAEALFLFFLVFAFLFCEQGRYLLAGLFSAGAGVTRNLGIFALIGLGLVPLRQSGYRWKRLSPRALWLLVGLAGPLAYMIFLAVRFEDPFLFIHAQRAWGAFNPGKILDYVFRTFRYGAVRLWGYPVLFLFHLLLGLSAIFLVLKERKALGIPYVVFSLLLVLPGFLRFTSLGRYLIVIFPLFVALGRMTEKRLAYLFTLSAEGALLILFSFLFSHWFWVA